MKLSSFKKCKNIIIFSALVLLLTGCTVQINEPKQKVETQKSGAEVSEGEKKDPSEMSLEEIEEELESMEDIEVEEDLDALDEEL